MKSFSKVLLLCRGVPPAPTGGAVVVGNLARQFRREEMVVVGGHYVGCPTEEWRPEWPEIKYATLHPPDGWRAARWIRWVQWPWLFIRAWWTLITERCDRILVVFPDEIFLLAGYMLGRLTGKPLFPYFHNTYLDQHHNSRLARWLQPRVFAISKHVFVMSEAMEFFYKERYPGLPCSALVHSFNGPLPHAAEVALPILRRRLRLVMFGNVNASNAEATTRFAKLVQAYPDVEITLFGGTSRRYLEQLGFTGDRVRIETVSRDVLLERLGEHDIILLPHGFYGDITSDEIATIFPTRTIEALISLRPILAHTPPDCFLTRFLRRHDCALIVDEPTVEALMQAMERLREDESLRVSLVQRALATARQFQGATVAAHLREVIWNGSSVVQRPTEVTAKL